MNKDQARLLGWLVSILRFLQHFDAARLCLQCADTVGWAAGRAFGL